jgi:hydroxyacylglutathione hydrolase
MFLRMIYDDTLAQAAYLIGCQRTGEAIVIDPERDIDRYMDLASANGLRIVASAETHIHADFLSGSRELAERLRAKAYLSDEGDRDWKYGWLDAKRGGGTYEHQLLHDGDTFSVGNITFRALHTPGHTPEHLAFEVTDSGSGARDPIGVVTGDFVFVGDLGRPDLLETAAGFAGVKELSARRLRESALAFLELPDHLQVWPAHGAGSACGKALGAVPQSTVGYERRHSPPLSLAHDESRFVEFILEGQPEPPLYFARMKQLNRDGVPLLGARPTPRAIDANELNSRPQVIDTRPWHEFRGGHLPGSVFAPRGTLFATVLGSYIDPEQELWIVVDDRASVDDFVRQGVRIGYDKITGFVTPEVIQAHADQGGRLEELAEVTPEDVEREWRAAAVLDVRTTSEHQRGAIGDARNIAHTRLPEHLASLPRDEPILIHCQTGARSAAAASYLKSQGFDVVNVAGGAKAWQESGRSLSRTVTTA